MSFKSNVKGRQTKNDHKSSPCHYVTGELKRASGPWPNMRVRYVLFFLLFFFAIEVHIQSDISKASPEHYFRDVFRVQISSEEQPVFNILLPLSSFGLLNISECHLVFLLNFYRALYTPTPFLGCTLKKCHSLTQNAYFEFKYKQKYSRLIFQTSAKLILSNSRFHVSYRRSYS